MLLAASLAEADLIVDGVNNFAAGSTYATSDASYTGYAEFGPSSLHFAMDGPDIQTGGGSHWFVTYLGVGTGPSTTTGVQFNTQQPLLPFAATHFFQWSPSGTALFKEFDGASWVDGASSWSVQRVGGFVEVGLSTSALGGADSADLVSYLLFEGSGFESSYAVFPSDAFANGVYDPNPQSSIALVSVPEVSPAVVGSLLSGLGMSYGARRRRD